MSPDTIASLVNLGAAGAVIVVVFIFLKFIREEGQKSRDFFSAINASTQADINDMRSTAEQLTKGLDRLLSLYDQHDTRAANIQQAIETIKAEIAKMARVRGSKA